MIRRLTLVALVVAVTASVQLGPAAVPQPSVAPAAEPAPRDIWTPCAVLAFNDLGMHCMNLDCAELLVLPPFNTLHAQVIDRTHGSPEIVTSDITVQYTIPGNTRTTDKTNFWTHAPAIFGVNLPPGIGLTGNGMSGFMTPTPGSNDWSVTGIPITQIDDSSRENPYNLATIIVKQGDTVLGTTQAVVPVSWEMSCNLCHATPGISTATDILRAHDRLHGTTLESAKPVLCAACHADPALGAPGQLGVSNLSSAMHTAHAPRMAAVPVEVECYACHPGLRTSCLRDVHFAAGMDCNSCHVSMLEVGNPARSPWADEPSCGGCHQADHPTWEFEEPGKLFRQSRGHRGIQCAACHGSPHAITPTVMPLDNVQAVTLQGHPGRIDTCMVCHSEVPDDPFPHRLTDDD